ncbi:hypothetical protein BT96DRAFT_948257 [Gymnopus androsaceus JB14]|uniref:Uncharacterized protein n=1 Tax=Gymnopus androsaceus JB14 TaxID=1447944 RepID=A0A6A4GQP8_9AGAR|nr:hypothetical protein BT96DRAFT_948257 [Gymnopus androsaceus JB14]
MMISRNVLSSIVFPASTASFLISLSCLKNSSIGSASRNTKEWRRRSGIKNLFSSFVVNVRHRGREGVRENTAVALEDSVEVGVGAGAVAVAVVVAAVVVVAGGGGGGGGGGIGIGGLGEGLTMDPSVYLRRPWVFSEFTILRLTGAQPTLTPPSNFRSAETSGKFSCGWGP